MLETASWGRRLLAIVIDWIACVGVVLAFTGSSYFGDGPRSGVYLFLVFILESAFFTALMGGSFGHLATRLRVVRPGGRPLDLLRAIARPVLILLVVPPLVAGPDRRGLHDMILGSYVVRLDDLHASAKASA